MSDERGGISITGSAPRLHASRALGLVPSPLMGSRKTVDVELSPAEALAIVDKSVVAYGGWTTTRDQNRLLVCPSERRKQRYDPKRGSYTPDWFPETFAVRVEAAPLPAGGTCVTAEIVRYRLLEHVGKHVGSLLPSLLAAPLATLVFTPIAYGWAGFVLLKNLRGAKHRMIRLAIEPLLPHAAGRYGGPFRH